MHYGNVIRSVALATPTVVASTESPVPLPKAVGLVRTEITGRDTAAVALDIQCHAHHLGYRWIYTVRPPEGTFDPVGYTCAIAAGLDAAAIIVFDSSHFAGQPGRITADFELVTVAPPRWWARGALEPAVVPSPPFGDCTWDPTQLERDCARRLWQVHRDCLPDCRARLAASAALSALDEVD